MEHFKELNFHNAPRHLLSKIIQERRHANRRELEVLFMRHCIGHAIEQHIVEYFKDNELQRFIALELYRANVIVQGKDKYCVMHQITDALGVHNKTVKGWIFNVYANGDEG